MREFGLSMIAFVILCLPMFGLLIGVRRNKKRGEEIRRQMDEEEKEAQERAFGALEMSFGGRELP